jgi:hypothetical protein
MFDWQRLGQSIETFHAFQGTMLSEHPTFLAFIATFGLAIETFDV